LQDCLRWNVKPVLLHTEGMRVRFWVRVTLSEGKMDNTTLLIILLVVLILLGGGWYGRSRWRGRR
jgi:hypothetical protein